MEAPPGSKESNFSPFTQSSASRSTLFLSVHIAAFVTLSFYGCYGAPVAKPYGSQTSSMRHRHRQLQHMARPLRPNHWLRLFVQRNNSEPRSVLMLVLGSVAAG